MKVKVNFYGVLAEVTGKDQLEMQGTEDLNSLREKLYALYPLLGNYTSRACVGKNLMEGNHKLTDGSIVSFLPPFSGG